MVRNLKLYRAALALARAPQPAQAALPVREILRRRSRFKKRPCQCCGRIFQPLGRSGHHADVTVRLNEARAEALAVLLTFGGGLPFSSFSHGFIYISHLCKSKNKIGGQSSLG
jgi:hypothetical protein